MTEFAAILLERKIDPDVLVRRSAEIERDRAGSSKRWRGASAQLVEKAIRGAATAPRVRGKLYRALRDMLGSDFNPKWTVTGLFRAQAPARPRSPGSGPPHLDTALQTQSY